MSLDYSSDQISGFDLRPPAFPHSAGEVHMVQGKVTLDASTAASDLVGFVKLPKMCVPVDIVLFFDDIDSGAGIVWDVGVLNTDEDDLVTSSLLIDGSTGGQSAGLVRMDDYECAWEPATWLAQTDAPDDSEHVVVAGKIMTAASTAVAGDIYATVYYRSKLDGK